MVNGLDLMYGYICWRTSSRRLAPMGIYLPLKWPWNSIRDWEMAWQTEVGIRHVYVGRCFGVAAVAVVEVVAPRPQTVKTTHHLHIALIFHYCLPWSTIISRIFHHGNHGQELMRDCVNTGYSLGHQTGGWDEVSTPVRRTVVCVTPSTPRSPTVA